ncbi:MAG TPA: hypothetical protein DCS87_17055 [Rheinheimera sp.]|nr:hypothetical protein [Rheinheimera sp.]
MSNRPSLTPSELAPTGLGLRREHVTDLLALTDSDVAALGFLEFAPENWLPFGGILQQRIAAIAERFPLVCHGLSLNIGGVDPINVQFLRDLKQFFDRYPVQIYSEHLSYTAAGGQLYDLLPLPFRQDAVTHVVSRIQQVQDALQRPLVLENISFYSPVAPEMTELEFLLEVLKQSGCGLLLDVNNVYVNSINHGYDAKAFIDALPTAQIRYGHIAGHYQQAPDLLIDTHGSDVCDEVWQLLKYTYQRHGVFPTLLERDFNLPPLPLLLQELNQLQHLQQQVREGV